MPPRSYSLPSSLELSKVIESEQPPELFAIGRWPVCERAVEILRECELVVGRIASAGKGASEGQQNTQCEAPIEVAC
jgi:hypothetical protein